MKKNIKFTLFILLLFGCQSKTNFVSEYMKNYPDISGKKIEIPDGLTVYNKKTLSHDFFKTEKKIICTGYMDCSPCIIRLMEIEDFIRKNGKWLKNVKIIYIATGDESDYFTFKIKENNFSFPILYDPHSVFLRNNSLENYDKSVFLLNNNNEIILVGSPFKNSVIQKYYKELILKK